MAGLSSHRQSDASAVTNHAKGAMLTAREKAKASRISVANPCIIVPFQLKIGAKKQSDRKS
jgi:hypothetical protein